MPLSVYTGLSPYTLEDFRLLTKSTVQEEHPIRILGLRRPLQGLAQTTSWGFNSHYKVSVSEDYAILLESSPMEKEPLIPWNSILFMAKLRGYLYYKKYASFKKNNLPPVNLEQV